MDNLQESHWWSSILYKDAKTFIKENLSSMAKSYIAVGYYLRSIRENEGYKEDGYQNVHELAEAEFGMKRQTVDHCIRVNKKFSKDGESPVVAEEYREFKKAQLQEMLYLTDDQILEVKPEMSVRQIREIRKGGEEKKELIQPPEAEEVRHFTKEPGIDQAYGWTWNELVKAFYAARRDRPDALVYRIPLFGKEYIVLEKENVVEFKNEDGRILFDVENGRIDSEYARWVEKNKKDECSMSSIPEPVENVPAEEKTEELSALGFAKRVYPEDSLIKSAGCGKAFDCTSCHRKCNIRQEECYCVEAPMGNPFPCVTLGKFVDLREKKGNVCQFVNLELAYKRTGDQEPEPCCKECKEECAFRCARAMEVMTNEEGDRDDQKDAIDMECGEIDFSEAITLEQVLKEEIGKLEEWRLALKEDGCETDAFFEKQKLIVEALTLLAEKEVEKKTNIKEQPELPKLKNKKQREEWLENYKAWPVWTKNEVIEETLYRYDLPDGYTFVIRHFPYTYSWKNEETENQRYYILEPGYKHLAECAANKEEMIRHLQEMQKGGKNEKSKKN